MHWEQEYFDLCDEIEILHLRVKDLEKQLEIAHDTCYGHSMPLDKALTFYDGARERLNTLMLLLDSKRTTKIMMERSMEQFKSVAYQVAYRRDIVRQSLKEIADDLGYSYGWVRQISMKAVRMKRTFNEQSA